MMDQKIIKEIKDASRIYKIFSLEYYEIVDKKRYMMTRLYAAKATLLWHGNYMIRNERIQKFFLELPPSKHTLVTLKAQPVIGAAVGDAKVVVEARGTVKFLDEEPIPFQQFFTLTGKGNNWKILNDFYRLLEPTEESSDSDD